MLYYFALLSPCFASIFWAITIITNHKRNAQSRNLWVAALVIIGISTLIWGVYFAGVDNHVLFYKLEAIEALTTLLLPAMLFFCFGSMINEKPFGWKEFLWLTPTILLGLSIGVLYMFMGEERSVAYVKATIESQGCPCGLSGLEAVMSVLSGPVYFSYVMMEIMVVLIYATVGLIRYYRRLNELFSNLEGKSMENIRALLIGGYLMVIFSLALYRGRFHYNEPSAMLAAQQLCWCVLIYFMGYHVYRLEYTGQTLASELEEADREATEHLFSLPRGANMLDVADGEWDRYDELLPAFEGFMTEEKIFLLPDICLDDVARMMRTNRAYISRMINERYGRSFSDVINRRRIRWAQELLRNEPTLTIEELAVQSGFTEASYFSRTFRKYTGMTCREWQRRNDIR